MEAGNPFRVRFAASGVEAQAYRAAPCKEGPESTRVRPGTSTRPAIPTTQGA